MKKLFLFFALISPSLFAITIVGSPNVEINSEGLYLVQIKISSTNNLKEDDISITDFKSDMNYLILILIIKFLRICKNTNA